MVTGGEWGGLVREMGPLLGIVTILIRVVIALHFSFKGWLYLVKGNALPWLLVSFGFLQLVTANWAQPTAMGFAIFTCGLVIASFNAPRY